MKKRLKMVKKRSYKMGALFFCVGFLTFSFYYLVNRLYQKYIKQNDSLIVDLIIDNSMGNINIANLEKLQSPEFILKYVLNQNLLPTAPLTAQTNIKNVSDPLVYIYNSHPTEAYSNDSLEPFSIIPTVVTADYILKEYLEQNGISTIVETDSVTDILKKNGWRYGYSYKASRMLLESAYLKNNTLKIFIDIHRDSAGKNATTININGLNYAKLMFVVGLEHDSYEQNLELANNINDRLKSLNINYTRGVLKKSGFGVNGIYNQDFNSNTILIEVGGPENTIEEINNTLQVFAKVLAEYLGENYGY